MSVKDWFLDFARGSALGLGMVPGVSAGTVGIVVNVYDKLINGISNLRKAFFKSVLTLLPIGIGAVLASLIVLFAVHKTFNYAPVLIISLFAGLTIGSIPLLYDNIREDGFNIKSVGLMIIGFVVAAGIGVLSAISKLYWSFDLNSVFITAPWWLYFVLFVAGFITAIACIVPGISGSMILFILGLYNPILNMFSLSDPNSAFNNHDRILPVIGLTLTLALGVIVGLVAASTLMKALIAKHKVITFDVVIGFVSGSVVSMFANQSMITDEGKWVYSSDITKPWMYAIAAALLVAGFFACLLLTKKTKSKN